MKNKLLTETKIEMADNQKLFSKRETYERLHVSLSTLDRNIRLGRIIPCKLGTGRTAKVLFTEREINRFIRAAENESRRRARYRMRTGSA